MKKNSNTSTLWIVALFGGTIFQYWRGSQVDTLIYATITALLLLASQDILEIPKLEATSLRTSLSILLISTSVFIFAPIHSIITAVLYLVLVPFLLKDMWRNDAISDSASTPALRRSSWIWFTIGLLMCLAELGNYFAAAVTHNDKAYPTITVLVDPFVANNAGKVFFVILWSMIGVGLLRVSEKK